MNDVAEQLDVPDTELKCLNGEHVAPAGLPEQDPAAFCPSEPACRPADMPEASEATIARGIEAQGR